MYGKIRPALCFSIALLLLGGTVSPSISIWLSYNQNAFAVEDITPPTFVSAATATTTTIDVTFSEPIFDNSATPGYFVIAGVATPTLVTSLSASGSVLTLTLDQPMTDADVLTVAYTATLGSIDELAVPPNSLATFPAQPVTNNLDTTAPAAPVITTASGTTSNTTPTIDGTAEPGTTVDVFEVSVVEEGGFGGLTFLGTATADITTGEWSATLPEDGGELSVGPHIIIATATDAAGNRSAPSVPIILVIDPSSPRSGGPDHLGYTFIDSNSQVGPTFDWIEIKDTGTRLQQLDNEDDKVQSGVPIGFTFNYYGIRKSQVDVTTNGLVLTAPDDEAESFSNVPIGDPDTPNNFVAPFWDDLILEDSSAVYSQTIGEAPNRIFVVEWLDVPHCCSSESGITFEAILHEGTNDIRFQYLDVDFGPEYFANNGASATVGIESADGRGLQYSFEEPVLSDNLAILFQYPSVLPPLPPVTVDDAAATNVSTPVTIDVLANDYDPNNDAISISDFDTFSEEDGTISLVGASLTYTPPEDFVGTDTFTYTISDGNGGTSTGTVVVHVLLVRCEHPDFFGYTCTDSNSQGGPAFGWIDLTSTGTRIDDLDGADDDFVGGIKIGFPFKFYGTDFTDLAITTNGLILANSDDSEEPESFSNEPIGDSEDVSNFIAPFWDDLVLEDDDGEDTGGIFYKTLGEAPNRQFVVEWFDIPHCCSSPSGITFEAILHEGTNDIRFQYLDVDFDRTSKDNGASATVGIESPDGRGLQYSFDEAALSNNLAILFTLGTPNVGDTTPPVITLLGQSTVTVEAGSTYEDAGATALDNIDGDLTLSIVTVNPVNTGVVGTYTVTYDVTDAAGNHATQVTRTVHVVSLVTSIPVDVTLGFTVPEGTAVVTPVTVESPSSEHGLLISFLGGIVDITLTSGSCASGCPIFFTFTDGNLAAAGISDLTSIRILEDHSGTGTGFVPLDTTILDGAPSPYTVSATTFSNSLFGVGVVAPDTIPPVITLPAPGSVVIIIGKTTPVTLEDGTTVSEATVTYTAIATDNVDGNLTPSCTPPSGSSLAVGDHIITCTATDAAGNTGSASITITIVSGGQTNIIPILPEGTISVITPGATLDGITWSLTQTSEIPNTVTIKSDTADTTVTEAVAGGTNTITLAFLGEVLNIEPAAETLPCAPTCTISIQFTQADLNKLIEQGFTLDTVRILHDSSGDGKFQSTEALKTTVLDKDGNICVVEGVVVCVPENGPFTATATIGSFSKFAIGGVKVLFLAGLAGGDAGGAGPSVSQFSVNTANQAGFAAILELDPNKPHTNVVDTFDPSTVTMRLAHPEGASSVQHVAIYLDLGGIFRDVANSDTYIVWDKNKELQVVDPQGFMKDVDLKVTTVGKSLQLKLSLTFVKEMPKSDVLVRTWDSDLNTRNIRYKDAIQIVPPQTISPESKVPVFVKNNAKFWADGQITDGDFTKGIQYLIENKIMIVPTPSVTGTTTPSVTGTTTPSVAGTTSPIISGTTTTPGIPAWVKNNAKWWSEDQITEKDFLSGIQWMIANGVITVSK